MGSWGNKHTLRVYSLHLETLAISLIYSTSHLYGTFMPFGRCSYRKCRTASAALQHNICLSMLVSVLSTNIKTETCSNACLLVSLKKGGSCWTKVQCRTRPWTHSTCNKTVQQAWGSYFHARVCERALRDSIHKTKRPQSIYSTYLWHAESAGISTSGGFSSVFGDLGHTHFRCLTQNTVHP